MVMEYKLKDTVSKDAFRYGYLIQKIYPYIKPYWARIIISQNGACYLAKPADSKRCFDTINNRLYYAGYPELYAGNPYDWLFMWALNDETPLEAFRYYMGEVFAERKEKENY